MAGEVNRSVEMTRSYYNIKLLQKLKNPFSKNAFGDLVKTITKSRTVVFEFLFVCLALFHTYHTNVSFPLLQSA